MAELGGVERALLIGLTGCSGVEKVTVALLAANRAPAVAATVVGAPCVELTAEIRDVRTGNVEVLVGDNLTAGGTGQSLAVYPELDFVVDAFHLIASRSIDHGVFARREVRSEEATRVLVEPFVKTKVK